MNRRQISMAMVLGGTVLGTGQLRDRQASVRAGRWASLELVNPLRVAVVGIPAVVDAQVLQHGVAPSTGIPAAIRFVHEASGEERTARLEVISEEFAIVRGEHTFSESGTWRMQTFEMGPEVELGTVEVLAPEQGAVISELDVGAEPAVACSGGTVADGVEMDILDGSFSDPLLEIPVGTTVTWVNTSTLPHQIAFEGRKLDGSTMLKEGDRFSATFGEAGEYAYYCAPHPYMTGIVRVS